MQENRRCEVICTRRSSRLEVGTGSVRTLINVGRLGTNEQRRPEDEVYELTSSMP